MKNALTLLLSLTIVLSCLSQNDCKGLTLINGDTLNLYDSLNIQKLKKVFIDLDESDSLLSKCEIDILEHISYEEGLKSEIIAQKEKIGLKDGVIKEKAGREEILTEEVSKKDKKINLLKKTRMVYAGAGAVVGSVSLYYLSQILTLR